MLLAVQLGCGPGGDGSVSRPRKGVDVIDSNFLGEKRWQKGVLGSFKKEEEKDLQRHAEVTILESVAINRGGTWSKAGEGKRGRTRL